MTSNRPLPSEEDLQAIRDGVKAACAPFDDEYWLTRDDDGRFPHEFHRAMADGGWLGITMPEEYGGSGLGVTEAAIMMHEVASHGGAMAALVVRDNLRNRRTIQRTYLQALGQARLSRVWLESRSGDACVE